jgi:hypothetical protein
MFYTNTRSIVKPHFSSGLRRFADGVDTALAAVVSITTSA